MSGTKRIGFFSVVAGFLGALGVGASPTLAAGCRADFNHDGGVTIEDLLLYLHDFDAGLNSADINDDGGVTIDDLLSFLRDFDDGCGLYPNLRINSVTTPTGPRIAVPGCDLRLNVEVRNIGKSPVQGRVWFRGWLTFNAVLGDFDDAPLEEDSVVLSTPLAPGQSRIVTLNSLRSPPGISPGVTNLVLRIDSRELIEEVEEQDNTILQSGWRGGCADAWIALVSVPDNVLSGGALAADVTVENLGPCSLRVPFDVVCGPNRADCWVDVQPYSAATQRCVLLAPPSQIDCGDPDPAVVSACIDTAFICDSDWSNNCASDNFNLVDPYWDLEYTISSTDTPNRNTWYNYTVRVRNVGNSRSGVTVCSRTAISLNRFRFERIWTDMIWCNVHPAPLVFQVSPLNPGESRNYPFSYFICNGARPGTQYINAAPDYFNNCGDACGDDNNNGYLRIQVP